MSLGPAPVPQATTDQREGHHKQHCEEHAQGEDLVLLLVHKRTERLKWQSGKGPTGLLHQKLWMKCYPHLHRRAGQAGRVCSGHDSTTDERLAGKGKSKPAGFLCKRPALTAVALRPPSSPSLVAAPWSGPGSTFNDATTSGFGPGLYTKRRYTGPCSRPVVRICRGRTAYCLLPGFPWIEKPATRAALLGPCPLLKPPG